MFLVVNFVKVDEVEVIHKNWLEDDTSYFWPPFKNSSKIKKLTLDGAKPDDDWMKYEILIMGSYNYYEKAREKATLAEFTSSLETEDSDREKEKSRQRRRKRIFSESDSNSESESIIDRRQEAIHKRPNLPEPSKIFCNAPISGMLHNNAAFLTQTPSVHKSNNCASTSNELSPFKKIVLRKLEELQRSMDNMNMKLNSLLPRSQSVEEFKLPFSFPLDKEEELKKFDIYLKNPSNFSKSVKYFGSKGGTNVSQTTRRIMSSIMSDHLATYYNWAGKAPKNAFKHLTVCHLVVCAVRENNALKEANGHEVEEAMKGWLKHSSFRLLYQEKKKAVI